MSLNQLARIVVCYMLFFKFLVNILEHLRSMYCIFIWLICLLLIHNLQAQVHYCECKQGYIGESCSLLTLGNADSNKWFDISSTSSVFTPRIAHSIVYIEKSDTLLAFGGLYSMSFQNIVQCKKQTKGTIKLRTNNKWLGCNLHVIFLSITTDIIIQLMTSMIRAVCKACEAAS